MATDVSALVAQECFDELKAPIRMVTSPHCAGAVLAALEDLYIPRPDKIEAAVRAVMGKSN